MFRLTVGLWVVRSGGDVIHPESTIRCDEEVRHELRTFIGKELKRNSLVCVPVLKKDMSYWSGIRICGRYRFG